VVEDVIIFPHTEITLAARDPRSKTALLQAAKERQLFVFVPGSDSKGVSGSIGTLVLVLKTAETRGGVNALVKGLWRVSIERVIEEGAYARVRFTKAEETGVVPLANSDIMKIVHGQIDELVRLIPGIPPQIIEALRGAETPGELADLCAFSPDFSSKEKLDLLRTLGGDERLEKISRLFDRRLVALRELAKLKKIPDCETCMELADRTFEADPGQRAEIAVEFLNHVVQEHTNELLGLLAEKYGPGFMSRRALK
jgi:ATP-dependent Lon protease